ncbi:MAG: helix-turn-helix domain-containing protein [Planctomycetota bacterium]
MQNHAFETATASYCSLEQLGDPCSSAELARLLQRSPKTIVDWCQEREYTLIPCFKIGNRWHHRVAELKRWLNGIKSGQIEFRRAPRNSAERR